MASVKKLCVRPVITRMTRSERVTISIPEDELEFIDEYVEESTVFEGRSHYLRVCHRQFQARVSDGGPVELERV